MKFSRASLSLLLVGSLGAVGAPPEPSPTRSKLEALERREFENPKSPAAKAALAEAYWCAERRGLAVESWLWLRRYVPKSPEAKRAASLVEEAQKSPKNLSERLCSDELKNNDTPPN